VNSTDTCKQGCRLFSLIQLTNNRFEDHSEQVIHNECSKSCRESYTDEGQDACEQEKTREKS
uniref:Uncharacterized protein n=1 Tax=Romanomermis culicivorax TaxID=13658 RepID=A0A915JMT7_ROMCU